MDKFFLKRTNHKPNTSSTTKYDCVVQNTDLTRVNFILRSVIWSLYMCIYTTIDEPEHRNKRFKYNFNF